MDVARDILNQFPEYSLLEKELIYKAIQTNVILKITLFQRVIKYSFNCSLAKVLECDTCFIQKLTSAEQVCLLMSVTGALGESRDEVASREEGSNEP